MSRDRCERCRELRHLRAHAGQRRFPSLPNRRRWDFDDSFWRSDGWSGAPEDQFGHGSEGGGFECLRGHTDTRPTLAGQRQSASATTLGCNLADRRTTTRVRDRRVRLERRSMLDPAADVWAAVFDNLLPVSDLTFLLSRKALPNCGRAVAVLPSFPPCSRGSGKEERWADSVTAEDCGSRCGEECDEAPSGWYQSAILLPYRPYVPKRLAVSQRNFDQRWVVMWRGRQHGDA
jgi:hypothetical protein